MFKDRKNVIRLVLFLLALGIALFAFARGVLGLGHRESGYYTIEPTAEVKTTVYDSGLTLTAWFEGSSSQIRLAQNELAKEYSDILLRAYQLLDPVTTYEGMNNLATLNQRPGEPVEVDFTLYGVLTDALERYAQGQGYSPFAGALYAEWQGLTYLEEPETFDPLFDEYEAERISALAGADRYVHLTLDDGTAQLDVDDEYLELVGRYEIDAPALTLTGLRDAYLMEVVGRELIAQGFTNGYLRSDSGLTLMLEQDGQCEYLLYAQAQGEAFPAGAVLADKPSASCLFTAFPTGESRYGCYAVTDEAGKTHLRHRNPDPVTGDFADVLSSAVLVGGRGDLVDLAYQALIMNVQMDEASLVRFVKALPEGYLAAWTLQGSGKTVLLRGDEKRFTPAEGVTVLVP